MSESCENLSNLWRGLSTLDRCSARGQDCGSRAADAATYLGGTVAVADVLALMPETPSPLVREVAGKLSN
jgi:hypothetical protein